MSDTGGWSWRRGAVLGVAAAAVAGASLALWLLRRPRRVAANVAQALRQKTILVVETNQQWRDVSAEIRRRLGGVPVLGFDCEWVTEAGSRRPVALLQLSTLDGFCVLVRLCRMVRPLPDDLKSLLRDRSVLKVGVACLDDAGYLLQDHGLAVAGCVDLCHLAARHRRHAQLLARPGLAALAHALLGVKMAKGRHTRCSNWEAETLTEAQQSYAADDALVGALLFRALLEPKVPELTTAAWPRVLSACQGLLDAKYRRRPVAGGDPVAEVAPPGGRRHPRATPTTSQMNKSADRAYALRKTTLYDNARLLAPDGQPLSVVESSKARWYVTKELGDVVEEEPLVVKLRFEPAGRPQKEGTHGRYYLQEKENCCVRCGARDGYVKKSIVPQEYRKHFPGMMKSHQSHDVLLMCLPCHQESNRLDLQLRYQLADECNAPIGTETDVKVREDRGLRRVKSAGRALSYNRAKLPPERVTELEQVLMDYYGVAEVTGDIVQDAVQMNTNKPNEDYMSHGEAVYRHFCRLGLIHLEMRWRQHFLDTMQPQYLPALWSVHHHHAKVRWKIQRSSRPMEEKRELWRKCFGTEYTDVPIGVEGDVASLEEEKVVAGVNFIGLNGVVNGEAARTQ